MLKNKMLTVIVIIIAAALGGGIMTFAIGLPGSPCAGIAGVTRNFTILATVNGFNDSVNHQQESWPVMSVHRCDIVKITMINKDTQTHGLGIDYYAAKGADIPGGQTLSEPPFLASRNGHFRVYCTTLCTIHQSVLNGSLNVV
jgi:heme/copper-type cytochrome/quinol oxidase subunit 2